jgi:hypothetical protein
MITKNARKFVLDRSGGMCEAEVQVPMGSASQYETNKVLWTRCGKSPVEVHHALTRGRGGGSLDLVEETYHLIALCPACHRSADGMDAYLGDLLIEGSVTWDPARRMPVYYGPDQFLTEKYGPK